MEIKRIEWSFNTPKAPWQGGFFERLVKSVRKAVSEENTREGMCHL